MTVFVFRQAMDKGPRVLLAALLLGSLLCSACAGKYGERRTDVRFYPDCYEPINELRKSEFSVEKSSFAGAAMGSALGAIIGLLASDGRASGALIGATAGAAVGGAVGYGAGRRSQDAADDELLADYNSRLEGDVRESRKATAAARLARQCYDRQFTVAASEYKAGRLTRTQFSRRYHEILSGMEEAAVILGRNTRDGYDVVTAYKRAINEEAGRRGLTPERVRRKRTAAADFARDNPDLVQVVRKNRQLEGALSEGRNEEQLLQQRLVDIRQQAEDLMS